MPLPFEGDPALLGQLLVGVSEVDQERRRRQDRKQERSLLVAVPAVFGTLQRIEDIMGDPMQPNIAEECCKKNCLQRLVIDRDSYGSELHRGLKTLQQAIDKKRQLASCEGAASRGLVLHAGHRRLAGGLVELKQLSALFQGG